MKKRFFYVARKRVELLSIRMLTKEEQINESVGRGWRLVSYISPFTGCKTLDVTHKNNIE